MNDFLKALFGGGHNQHVFERPICITRDYPDVDYAAKTVLEGLEKSSKEMQAQFEALHLKSQKVHKQLWDIMTQILKEKNLFPKDYNEETDHLSLSNGVIFHMRHNEGLGSFNGENT